MTSEEKEESLSVEPENYDTLKALARTLRWMFRNATLRRDRIVRGLVVDGQGKIRDPKIRDLIGYKRIIQVSSDPQQVVQAIEVLMKDLLEIIKTGNVCDWTVKRIKPITPRVIDPSQCIPLTLVVGNLPPIPSSQEGTTTTTTICIVESNNKLKSMVWNLLEQYGRVSTVYFETRANAVAPKGSALVEFEDETSFREATRHLFAVDTVPKDDTNDISPAKKHHKLSIQQVDITVERYQVLIDRKKQKLQEDNDKRNEHDLKILFAARDCIIARSIQGVFEIPSWKNLPFCPGQPVYLYRLTITLDHAKPFDMGLLLPIDLADLTYLSGKQFYQTNHLFLPTRSGREQRSMVARLEQQQQQTAYANGLTEKQLGMLRFFHRTLLRWKSYGKDWSKKTLLLPEEYDDFVHRMSKAPDEGGDVTTTTTTTDASTFLFVPIAKRKLYHGEEISIDWNMVQSEVVDRKSTRFVPNKEGNCFLDYLALLDLSRYRILGSALKPQPSNNLDVVQTKTLHDTILEARLIQKMEDENWCLKDISGGHVEQTPNQIVHLEPAFVEILPVPLSLLFAASLAPYLMPSLERHIDLCLLTHRFRLGAHFNSNERERLVKGNIMLPRALKLHPQNDSLVELLGEATTLSPKPTYDRLEKLGDSVLGYFLALNCVVCSTPLAWEECRNDLLLQQQQQQLEKAWDVEKFNDYITVAGKNCTLAAAAREIQLEGILKRNSGFRSWYDDETGKKPKYLGEVSNKTLSETVESILGAAFLAEDRERLTIYFLKLLRHPLLECNNLFLEKEAAPVASYSGIFTQRFDMVGALKTSFCKLLKPLFRGKGDNYLDGSWFRASSAALSGPYPPLTEDEPSNLFVQISRVASILQMEPCVRLRLEAGQCHLFEILGLDQRNALFSSRKPSTLDVLLQCALFDDDLMDDVDWPGQALKVEEFLPLALLREQLYFVGARALQVLLLKELFLRFGDATSGDLHMMQACSMDDDVIAYIMLKNDLHKCLYDQASESLVKFSCIVKEADKTATNLCSGRARGPDRYPGLVGGCLCGHAKKIPKKHTEELMVSFKSIVGALVLSLGAEKMWSSCRPLFHDLLVFSPEMLRERYLDVSHVVRAYTSNIT